MSFMDDCRQRVKGRNLRIVYPEGNDERARAAAQQLVGEGLGAPILLGGPSLAGVEVRDPSTDPELERFEALYLELRKHKGMTAERAALREPHYFGAMMVRQGLADGMVSGLRSEVCPDEKAPERDCSGRGRLSHSRPQSVRRFPAVLRYFDVLVTPAAYDGSLDNIKEPS
jgi:hypothetical protein